MTYKKEIRKLFNKGYSYKQIVKVVGCALSTVSYYCNKDRNYNHEEGKNGIYINCKECGVSIYVKRSRVKTKKFCSVSCGLIYRNKLPKYKELSRIGGLKSAANQAMERRSKNEKLFAELCIAQYQTVLVNKPIFNGWDADVIIEDYKIAVLWNGKWHYKKITKKHSVKQVQNRDIIKINEIKKAGYAPYIIKDLGKCNPGFVEKEFNKFKKYTNVLRNGSNDNSTGSYPVAEGLTPSSATN